jgi:hypothetical protein
MVNLSFLKTALYYYSNFDCTRARQLYETTHQSLHELNHSSFAPTGELELRLQNAETAVASLERQLDSANASLTIRNLELVQQREELEEQLRVARQQLKVSFRLPLSWYGVGSIKTNLLRIYGACWVRGGPQIRSQSLVQSRG